MPGTSRRDEPEESLDRAHPAQLSHSKINRYLTCPEQYRLHYVERLRPKIEAANRVFGTLIHAALADFLRAGTDPVAVFLETWGSLKGVELRYGKRESWEGLRDKGEKLLQKFLETEAPKIREVESVEERFELAISTLDSAFVGIADLVAKVNGQRTVVDFKTSGSDYEEHEAALSDQLTAYWLADPQVQKAALCVLLKTKEPRIEWHFAQRDAERLSEYLQKVRIISEDIRAGKFYKRPGKHCSWCDFLPVCLGDKKRAKETLVRIS
jgi:CRISPR/Cas system-associated exonuclease Cas4 (RecB family)